MTNAPTLSRTRPLTTHRQHGAVLIVSLILLLVMTLIGVFAMRDTILQERMAGNARDRDMAFQAAEGALRDAARNISSEVAFTDPTSDSWEARIDQGSEYDPNATGNFNLAAAAQYVIEEHPPEPPLEADGQVECCLYRVTTRAVGGSTEAVVVLQAEFRR